MGLAATPNQASSGQRRGCSTAAIENDSKFLMLRPSPLYTPTLMGHFHSVHAILQALHTIRRKDMGLAATPKSGLISIRT